MGYKNAWEEYKAKNNVTPLDLFNKNNYIEKVFIEPHLKTRLNLTSNKIRFHGCQAVRHDDHIHLQVK